MKRRINFATAALILCAACTYARTVPALTGRIIDEAGILKAEDKRTLKEYLESLENEAGIQIAVLTVRSLEGDAIEAFAHTAAEMWRLGRAGEDNGALLVIAQAERKIRIETGYGLEGALTDTKCGLIIRNEIAPAFRSGAYSKGIVNGVKAIGNTAAGHDVQVEDTETQNAGGGADGFGMAAVLFIVLFWFAVFSNISSRRRRRGFLPQLLFWSALGASSGRRRHVRTFDSDFFSSGSSSGFSGGGGHFGGGGASGGW